MFNKKGFVYLFAVLGLMNAPSALAQKERIAVTLGEVRSPVLESVAAKRSARDGREIARTAAEEVKKTRTGEDQRQAEKKMIQRTLADAVVVAADLAELSPTPEDRLIIDAAREMGVPIAFENVQKDKMAQLLPMGIQDHRRPRDLAACALGPQTTS